MRLSKEQRRQQLLDVATTLFINKGYHETTTKDIANKAGVSEPVIYKHFTSKHELFFEVIYRIISESIKKIEIDENLEFDSFIENFIYQHLDNVDKHFSSIKFLFIQILQDEKVKQIYVKKFVPRMLNLITPYFSKINKEKINSYSPSFNFMLLGGILLIFELAKGLFDYTPENMNKDELSKRLKEVYLKAIVS